ncbi:hypothetical protein LDO31_12450 [Luteimonas sp. XNQY3]|nr:hypothetical protein [Luteimonas sp. XNQY3]
MHRAVPPGLSLPAFMADYGTERRCAGKRHGKFHRSDLAAGDVDAAAGPEQGIL